MKGINLLLYTYIITLGRQAAHPKIDVYMYVYYILQTLSKSFKLLSKLYSPNIIYVHIYLFFH